MTIEGKITTHAVIYFEIISKISVMISIQSSCLKKIYKN